MPSLAKRACSTPGCLKVASTGSQCADCTREIRGTTSERGYGKGHRRLRLLAFERDEWTCVDCGWRPTIVAEFDALGLDPPSLDAILECLRLAYNRGEVHLQADHIIPIETRQDLALDLDNYATRCSRCHNDKSRGETTATATYSGHSSRDLKR